MADFELTATVVPEVDSKELEKQLDGIAFGGGSGGAGTRNRSADLLESMTSLLGDIKLAAIGLLGSVENFFRRKFPDEFDDLERSFEAFDVQRELEKQNILLDDHGVLQEDIITTLMDMGNTNEEIVDLQKEMNNFLSQRAFDEVDRGGGGGAGGGFGVGTLVQKLIQGTGLIGAIGTALTIGVVGVATLLGTKMRKTAGKIFDNFRENARKRIIGFLEKLGVPPKIATNVTKFFDSFINGVLSIIAMNPKAVFNNFEDAFNSLKKIIKPFGTNLANWITSGLPGWAKSLLGIPTGGGGGGGDSGSGGQTTLPRSPITSTGKPASLNQPDLPESPITSGGRPNVEANITIDGQSREEVRREIDRALDQFDKEFQRANRGVR